MKNNLKLRVQKIAVCGVSNRALHLFVGPISRRRSSAVQIAALLDPDPIRFDVCKRRFPLLSAVPGYLNTHFQAMLDEVQPDALYVSGIDNTHVDYILAGLQAGLDVVVEKPMVTTWGDCQRVLEAERKSSGRVYVAFNFRYAPLHIAIKKLLAQGRIGRVVQVNMEYYLDPFHGASYFKRWHRRRASSGGLAVHKACHHFDLVAWWLDQAPLQVSAFGGLDYYGPHSAHRPEGVGAGLHCSECPSRSSCSYDLFLHRHLKHEAEHNRNSGVRDGREYTSYRPDACIFDPEIDVEDSYVASVRFEAGAMLSYSLNFSAPFEGYRLSISGTHGRMETQVYLHPKRLEVPAPTRQLLQVYDLFGGLEQIEIPLKTGGHLGGDSGLLNDLIGMYRHSSQPTMLASAREGALSVAVGDAINRSIKEQCIVTIPRLPRRTHHSLFSLYHAPTRHYPPAKWPSPDTARFHP